MPPAWWHETHRLVRTGATSCQKVRAAGGGAGAGSSPQPARAAARVTDRSESEDEPILITNLRGWSRRRRYAGRDRAGTTAAAKSLTVPATTEPFSARLSPRWPARLRSPRG